jgi:excisionase family DNA binding protein
MASPGEGRGGKDPSDDHAVLTVHEVAAQLQVAPETVRRWVRSGELPAIIIGRTIRIRQTDIDQHVRDNHRRDHNE